MSLIVKIKKQLDNFMLSVDMVVVKKGCKKGVIKI